MRQGNKQSMPTEAVRAGGIVNELVERLTRAEQPVAVGGPSPHVADLRERIEQFQYVFIKFTDTRGGTDLGVSLDQAATQTGQADFAHATGTVHIEGTLTLDFVPVRCIADIDLATLTGTGRLVVESTA
jgi:hypothetical protein